MNNLTKGETNNMKKLMIMTAILIGFTVSAQAKDMTRYYKCYGEMTNAHKARGFHQSNRAMSIQIKETICTAYANGEELDYEGKA
tara:strand:+ start:64 stop:318 length:255 start_codon:yes stop_codon:yes gene_type:complete